MKNFNWKNFLIVSLCATFLFGAVYKDGISYVRVLIEGPIDSLSGGVEVSVQDQTTRALDLYFTTTAGQGAPTTIATATAIDDTIIEVADSTFLQDGQYFGIFGGDPADPKFYFGTAIGAPVGNLVSVDSPVDTVFDSGSVVLPVSKNMAVDGSVTPVIFSIQAGGSGSSVTVDITRIMGTMETPSAVDLNRFGSGTALTNGLVLRQKNGIVRNIWNVKRNSDFAVLTFDFAIFDGSNPVQGIDGLTFRNSFGGQSKHGVVIRLEPGDELQIIVQDDMTTRADIFLMMAQGHFVSN
jgi:hypothetical protein